MGAEETQGAKNEGHQGSHLDTGEIKESGKK